MHYKRLCALFILSFLFLVFRLFAPHCVLEPITGFLLLATCSCSRRELGIFAASQIFLFDFLTFGVGLWTLAVMCAFCIIACVLFYVREHLKIPAFLFGATIIATLTFDILTGLIFGPLFFDQSFMQALAGQVPFTCMHLLGNGVIILGYIAGERVWAMRKLLKTNQKGEVRYEPSN